MCLGNDNNKVIPKLAAIIRLILSGNSLGSAFKEHKGYSQIKGHIFQF